MVKRRNKGSGAGRGRRMKNLRGTWEYRMGCGNER